jgi:phage portal protein BeeE
VDTLRGVWTYDGTPIDPADWRIVQRTLWPTVGPAEGAVIKLARDMIAQAAAMDGYALEFWANGGAPLTVLRSDQELSKAQAQDAKATYAEARNAGPGLPLVLGKGLDISGFGVDIAQAQGTTADSRHELISSLGRYWGIPPNFLNAPVLSGNLVYQTVEAAGQYLVSYTLEPYAAAVADMMSELLPADYVTGRHVTLGLDHLSKPSPGARATYYQTMTAIGAMTVAEVRDAEGLPPQESPTTPTPVAEPSEVEI